MDWTLKVSGNVPEIRDAIVDAAYAEAGRLNPADHVHLFTARDAAVKLVNDLQVSARAGAVTVEASGHIGHSLGEFNIGVWWDKEPIHNPVGLDDVR